MKRAALILLLSFLPAPVFAWYYFTARNGARTQWVFGSSCNSGSRPIVMFYDVDLPGAYGTAGGAAITNWNTHAGGAANLLCPVATCDPAVATYQKTMNATAVSNFLRNPTANAIWVVWDTDGSVLSSYGVDASSNLLGVGTGLSYNSARPQDICSGLLIMNASGIGSAAIYQKVFIHELGHVLGFAHSIAGNNAGVVNVGTAANLPVMFPFLYGTSPSLLNPDDQAAARAVYGQ